MTKIYTIIQGESFKRRIKPIFNAQGIEPVFFEKNKDILQDLEDCQGILFVEPYMQGDGEYTIHKVWKNYLEKTKFSYLKFMVASSEDLDHPNYFSLLRFPHDLHEFMANAQTISDAKCIALNRPCLQEGMDNFFRPHRTKSLRDRMNYFSMLLRSVHDISTGKIKRDFSYVEEELIEVLTTEYDGFYSRWKNYKEFTLCPFIQELNDIDVALGYIREFLFGEEITREQFLKNDCYANAQKIRTILNRMKTYIDEKEKIAALG